ncbi:hypothetical protein RhiirA5_424530, partial [Rhizophagus irregularis]
GSKEFCDILVGADGVNSPVRKQKLPELQIFDYGVTMIITDVAAPKNLLDRLIKLNGNGTFQETVGFNGDTTFIIFRRIPIEQENFENKNETYYRATIAYVYPTKLDDKHDEHKVVDEDLASIVNHNYISCIKEYENEMLKRNSADVLRSRFIALGQASQEC